MKITCDNCGAKYQVADEKVKNKVFKIRCKRCEHVIVVRGDERGQDAPIEEPSAAPADDGLDETRQVSFQATDDSMVDSTLWHIVIDGKQVGPCTPEDIAGYLGRGEVTADAFVWREGMGDWAKLSSVEDFQHLFSKKAEEVEQPSRGMIDPPPEDASADPADNDEDVMVSSHSPAEDAGLFAAVDGEHGDPRVSSGSQLTGQRNENSVLFSLDALSDDPGVPRDVENTGGTDGSGLIDISMLGTSGGADGGMDDVFGGDNAMGPAPIAMPRAMPSLVMKRRSNTGLIIGLSIAGVALAGAVGVAVYMAVAPKDPTKPAAEKVAATKTPKATGTKAAPVVVGQMAANKTKPKTSAQGSNQPVGAAPTTATNGAGTPGNAVEGGPKDGQTATAAGSADKKVDAGGPAVPAVGAGAARAKAEGESAPKTPAPAAKSKKVAKAKKRKKKRRRSRSRKAKRTVAKKRPTRAVAAPPPPPPPPPVRKSPPKRAAKSGGDGLDDLLSNVGNASPKKPAGNRRSARAAATPAPSTDVLLPEKLGRRDVFSVIQRNAGRVARCGKEQGGEPGSRIKVEFFINGSNGRVSQANIRTAKFNGTGAGDCVVRVVRGFRFKRFKDKQMKISIPFRL